MPSVQKCPPTQGAAAADIGGGHMLRWAVIFFLISVIAAFFGLMEPGDTDCGLRKCRRCHVRSGRVSPTYERSGQIAPPSPWIRWQVAQPKRAYNAFPCETAGSRCGTA